MRSVVVLIFTPAVDDATHLPWAVEPVLRQALISESTVEALDIGVLHGLTRLDEAQLDAVLRGQVCIVRPANSGPFSVRITLSSCYSLIQSSYAFSGNFTFH